MPFTIFATVGGNVLVELHDCFFVCFCRAVKIKSKNKLKLILFHSIEKKSMKWKSCSIYDEKKIAMQLTTNTSDLSNLRLV